MATITRGYTFGSTEQVTASKLHTLVDGATLSSLVDSDISASAAISFSKVNTTGQIFNADLSSSAAVVDTKLAQITTASKVHGSSITGLASVPSGAGILPIANLPTTLAVETAFTDYAATSTIVGWSSISLKYIFTKKIGRTVIVSYYITGTSNSTSTSFTTPYSSVSTSTGYIAAGYAVDNSGTASFGLVGVTQGAATITLYKDAQGSNWTSSGTKTVQGQIFYETT